MAEIIRMPKMSDTMQEGIIARWLKKVGDTVKSGDVLAEVETDKATMELESYDDGILLYIVEPNKSIAVNGIIAIIGEKDTDISKILSNNNDNTFSKSNEKLVEKTIAFVSEKITTQSESRIKISPIARKIATEKNIDIQKLQGSGDNGRIIKRDIETLSAQSLTVKPIGIIQETQNVHLQESFEDVANSSMRKTIAKRLSESKSTAPHFYLTIEICMDKAIDARNSLNADSPIKISFNDIIVKASATALGQHKDINAAWLGDTIRKNHHIHIGVAVAIPDGLLVPIVRFANTKSLSQISAEIKDLGQKAKEKKLQPADWEGSTFSISNLGMFGIDEFTAIINPPNACILAVGGIKQTPIIKNGQIVIGNMLKVTLSCDHRVVDGAMGATFLATLKKLIEDPIKILL